VPDNKSAPVQSVESILTAIKALPEQQRRELIDCLEYKHDWLLGYVMVPANQLDLMQKTCQSAVLVNHVTKCVLDKKATEAHRRGKCSRTRAEKTAKRHELIGQAIDVGIQRRDAQAIFNFVASEDPRLLYKSKRSNRPDIDPKNMMIVYWRSQRLRNNCNHSE
jgi:hypothetical protein